MKFHCLLGLAIMQKPYTYHRLNNIFGFSPIIVTILLIIKLNICFGCSKSCLIDMIWLRNKKKMEILELPTSLESWPEVIKLFSCSPQLSRKFILLINVKMPTIVDIITFISMINTTSQSSTINKFLYLLVSGPKVIKQLN